MQGLTLPSMYQHAEAWPTPGFQCPTLQTCENKLGFFEPLSLGQFVREPQEKGCWARRG